ncbi:MAG TPA: VOC family protein [Xanthobacteraceae bacterium]|nr:VOC family protein [Xanthobacteraceae bacterium]
MDAPNPSASPTFASRAPLHIGAVGMVVRDLDRLAAYYRDLLGLSVIERTGGIARLGVDGVVLLELEHRPDALPDDNREAGLYHTAFLMPTRADLARWIVHIARHGVPITGASDHDVSEAIYLDDPEGNGIEVYSDRPPERWRRDGKLIFQRTDPLDIEDILREIDPANAHYPAAPAGLRVGHVHLRVGNIAEAERFYVNELGLEVTRRRTGATFLSTGGYHHHIACNVWHSAGAGARNARRAGLAWFELEAADGAAFDAAQARLQAAGAAIAPTPRGFETVDPWGTRLRVTTAA